MRWRVVLTILAAAGLLAGAAAGLSWWRSAREARTIALLRDKLGAQPGEPAEHHWLGLRLADQGRQDESLAHLEIAAERNPTDLRFGNDLRLACIRFGRYDSGIAFLESLVEKHPDLPEPLLQLALSYIDKMPDHMMGIVGQGKLSKQSIALLTRILEGGRPRDAQVTWAALYALGMNHLYWPKALGHAPLSVDAFERCILHQRTSLGGPEPYFILPYLGLGDALVKARKHQEARRVWTVAQTLLGRDERLVRRLSIEDDEALTELVDETRGLGVVVDTDLAVLWGRKP
ncbi:MAG TPA: hypothetical protein VGK94_09540 [Candidatus Polarisedimenticolia bacterium]|jgi:tetratricopeptide (TPR) repeat protein